jgi:hypothetical protein
VNQVMLNDRENVLSALREKPLKIYEIMKCANVGMRTLANPSY